AILGAKGAGGTRADVLRRLQEGGLPVAAEKYAGESRKIKTEAAVEERAARKSQLENALKIYGIVGREAGPLKFLEEQDADLETMQVAYSDALGRMADFGIDVSKLPQEYKFGMADQALQEAVSVKDQITLALRAEEAAERKAARERKVPGRDVPFPADVEAQKKRISLARRAEKPPSQGGKALAERTKQRAMERAEDEYRKKLKALEKDWEYEPEGVDDEGNVVGLWFQRQSGLKITNDEMLELRQQAEEDLISDKEQADESYLAQLEALGFEPGEPVDYRKQRGGRKGQDPLGLFP
ncbi:hypothetical protein LCGC14_2739910, partial [marine sediment metagenome]